MTLVPARARLMAPLLVTAPLFAAAAATASAQTPQAPTTPPPASTPKRAALAPITFTEEAAARGLTSVNQCGDPRMKKWLLECIGNGCALFDMDGDGDLDLFLVESGRVEAPKSGDARTTDWVAAADAPCRLFENTGGGRFRDVTATNLADLMAFACGVTAADYDGDGDLDLFVTCWGQDHLLQNDGHGRFADATAKARVGDPFWSVGSTFFDADGDGDLDLYVANYFAMAVARDPACWKKTGCPWLNVPAPCGPKGMVPEPDSFFSNNGDGTFTDASVSSGIRAAPASFGLGVVAFDQDDDGDQDVYVGNDSRANFLWDNDGHGRFTEIGDLAGCAVSRNGLEQASMGIACGDYDGDGRADLFCTNFSQDDSTLYHNLGGSSFMDETGRHDFGPEAYLSLKWGTEFVDFDGDGDLDLFMACGHIYVEADQKAPEMSYRQLNRVYRNAGGRFVDVTKSAGPGMARKASFRGAAFGDVDDDGDVDVVVVAQNEAPSLLINQSPEPLAHTVVLELRGAGKNVFAIGAKVTAEIGGRKETRLVRAGGSFACSSDLRVTFGGIEKKIDRLVVRWPDGKIGEWKVVAPGRRLRATEGGALEEMKRP
jgi:enediyne biosynthesis protein E4